MLLKKLSCFIALVLMCACFAGCSRTPKNLNGKSYQFLGYAISIQEDTPEYFREKIEKKLQQDGDLDLYEGETLEQYFAEYSQEVTAEFSEGLSSAYISFAEDKVSLFITYKTNGERRVKDGGRYIIKENKVYLEEREEIYTLKGRFLYEEISGDGGFFDPNDDESSLLDRYIVIRRVFAEAFQ